MKSINKIFFGIFLSINICSIKCMQDERPDYSEWDKKLVSALDHEDFVLPKVIAALNNGADPNLQGRYVSFSEQLKWAATSDTLLGHAINCLYFCKAQKKEQDALCWFQIIELLINKGARVNQPIHQSIDHITYALHLAASRGLIDVVKLLIDRGADVNLKVNGFSVLEIAQQYNRSDVVLFFQNYFGIGKVLLHNAVSSSSKMPNELVGIIVEYCGADAGSHSLSISAKIAVALGIAMNYLRRK